MNHSSSFPDRLSERVRTTGSAVCVGLDPRREQLPGSLRLSDQASPAQWAESYRVFCRGVIDAVASMVPVVKPQAAFFEQLGPTGMVALHDVIQHARQAGLLVILDGKRNDIGSTAEAYADGYLGGDHSTWGCDSLTVSPYLGADSLDPFVKQCDQRDAGIFVLVKTSNPGGGFLQDRQTEGASVYEAVADLITELNASRRGDCGYGPVGAVVGATYPEQLEALRRRMPTAWILIPGFGAQGGAAHDVAAGFDTAGLGAIVNSSRHIIFAHARPPYREQFGEAKWQDAVAAATGEMNEQLRSLVSPTNR